MHHWPPQPHPDSKPTPAHEVLGVPPDADPVATKAAFRRGAMKWHPDQNPGDKHAEEAFKTLGQAYEAMKKPDYGRTWEAAFNAAVAEHERAEILRRAQERAAEREHAEESAGEETEEAPEAGFEEPRPEEGGERGIPPPPPPRGGGGDGHRGEAHPPHGGAGHGHGHGHEHSHGHGGGFFGSLFGFIGYHLNLMAKGAAKMAGLPDNHSSGGHAKKESGGHAAHH